MSQLVSARCPACGAGLQLDPEIAVASCGSCNASSFVQTSKRRAPFPQRGLVIDITPPRRPWWSLLGVVWMIIAVVVYALSSSSNRKQSKKELPEIAAVLDGPAPPKVEPPSEARPSDPVRPDRPPPPTSVVPDEPAPKHGAALEKRVSGSVRARAATVSGRLDAQLIQKIVRQSYPRIRMCYERGLASDPGLRGELTLRFVIRRDGTVSNVIASHGFPDSVAECVQASFYGLTFPKPEGGIVTVIYPLILTPGS